MSIIDPQSKQPSDDLTEAGSANQAFDAPRDTEKPLWFRLAWLPIPLLIVIMAVFADAKLGDIHDSPSLRFALNFAFSTLVSLFVAYLVGRSFLSRSTPGLLLLGCGVVIWGLAAVTSLAVAGSDTNVIITIFTVGTWLAALCHLAGVSLSLRPRRALNPAGVWLASSYVAALIALGLVSIFTIDGRFPSFFIEGQGGTLVRHLVLGSAVAMFALAAILLRTTNRKSLSPFTYWYSYGLALIAVGLFGTLFPSSFSSVLFWTARSTQWLGGVYMLVAAIASVRESHVWGISLEAALHESEDRLRVALDSAQFGTFDFNPLTGDLIWDAQMKQIWGIRPNEQLDYGHALERIHPEDRERVNQIVAASLAPNANGDYEAEYRIIWPDGTTHWSSAKGRIYFQVEGEQRHAVRMVGVQRDITAHKQAEEALRSSQAKLQSIIGSAMDAVISVDEQQRIVVFNRAAEAVFQCAASEAFGSTLDRFIPKSLCDVHREHIRRFGSEGITARSMNSPGILTALRSNGEEFPIEATISQVEADGEKLYTVILRDITERKKSEDALRESEAQFRTLANAIPQLCWMADADGWIFWYNQRWYQYTGTTPEQMEGWGWQSVHDPNELPKVLERWKASLVREEPFDMIFPLRGADGVFRPFLTRIVPIKDTEGKVVRWFGTNTDVTDLRNAQAALRASEERWSTTLRSIGDAVISTNANGRIMFMNEVAEKLTGWSLTEAQGRDLEEVFNIVNEVTRIKPENPVTKVIQIGQVVGLANHTALISRDGTELPIEDSGAPIRDKDGQITGVVLVFHDIIEKRRAEKAVRDSERLALTGRMASTLAHEIHNPLDTVGALLYLINQASDAPEPVRQHASLAGEELARVTQMTRHMLSFQREAKNPVPIKIGEILDNVLALYERKIESAGIRVEKQVDFEGEFIGLPGEMRQVFANLIGNAIEAIGKNGKIRLHAYASRDWRQGRRGLRVTVADNGPGIPADVRDKIFDPFFTTKGEGGTGLGLWIISGIIENNDGLLRLRTVARGGRSGTCFSVFFAFPAQ